MAKMWQQQPWDVLQSWIDAIANEASDNLNDFEEAFFEDMTIRIANKWPLTQKQEETLERIYASKTS